MEKILCILLIIFLINTGRNTNLNAQPPTEDKNWELITSKSDEFNASVLDVTKWDNCANIGVGWGYGNYLSSSNVILNNGYLNLRLSQSGSNYYVGQIRSKNYNYHFGYLEISAKILDPGNYQDGIPCTRGIVPTFWTYWVDENFPCYHDEIDILEQDYNYCSDVFTNTMGVWDKVMENMDPNSNTSDCPGKKYGNYKQQFDNVLFEDEHIYSAEWLPDKVIFYFDGKPISIYNGIGIPQNPQWVVLALAIHSDKLVPNLVLPQNMKINYFRYYELIDRFCNTDAVINSNNELSLFEWGIRRNISIGNGSSLINIYNGDSITFRASNSITIMGEFSVKLGGELNLVPTVCNQ